MLSFLHLTVFEALMRLKSVTQAAEALDMPQPTISRHLRHLREHFDNPLFVRTSHGFEPTSIAISAAAGVSEALEIYRTRLVSDSIFEAGSSRRNFFIAASDMGHLLTLPRLEQWAATSAPHVRFTATPLGRQRLITQLEAGEVDVAIGSFPTLYSGIREQTLFTETYVCVVPKALATHGELSLDTYRRARHILVDGRPLGHIHEEVERRILEIIGENQVRVVSENFLLSAHIAERSDLILTAPSRVAEIVNAGAARTMAPPIDLPGFTVKQYWHDRFDREPGNMWLRHTIARLRGLET
ncbi:LysR family transcriptional regulator [Sphingobium sp. B2]|uniref:LysR family transcriptional regulator n=1 Tax=Sphingobium sp. B2 TaxID=2583228 RepID=UPI0011A4E324|nr:LysR family transcriptional regulator [Sphingobium sp. B2]